MSSFEADKAVQGADPASPSAAPRFDGDAAGNVLNLLSLGLILVNPASEVLATNNAGGECLRLNDGLRLDGGLLTAETASDTMQIRRIIQRCIESALPDAMLVRRASGARPYVAVVRCVGASERRKAIVAVRENGARPPLFIERVKTVFRLAPAEADIAVQLLLGADLPEIAAARGVTVNTIRTQMASAMIKVGVHRQAELVGAVAGIDLPL